MAKRGIVTHPKNLALAEALGIPPCFSAGVLEALWQWVAEQRPTGDLTQSTPRQIAIAILYEPDRKRTPEALIEALVSTGFLDRGDRLLVHDWSDHAPDYVHLRLARAGLIFADGTEPSDKRLSKDERAALAERPASKKRAPGERTQGAQEAHGERTASAQNQHAVRTAVAVATATARPLPPPGQAVAAAAASSGTEPTAPNALVPDSDQPAVAADVSRLCVEIAEASGGDLDPSEVLSKASRTDRGNVGTNPASMSLPWLLRTRETLRELQRQQRGESVSAENREKVSGIATWLQKRRQKRAEAAVVAAGGGA